MKPSPMMDSIKIVHEVSSPFHVQANATDELSNVKRAYNSCREHRAALLALISAQPGGEGVTREQILKAYGVAYGRLLMSEPPGLNFPSLVADAIMELLRPTSPDPARAEQVPEREGK